MSDDDDKGVLELGILSQKYIDDPDLRGILANTGMDATKMKPFAECDKLLLITSVIYSEKFELKGERKQQVKKQILSLFIRYYLGWKKDGIIFSSVEKIILSEVDAAKKCHLITEPTLFPNSKEKFFHPSKTTLCAREIRRKDVFVHLSYRLK